ncbi:hypothetical protein N665_0076s0134 [Sinapis alba]|nr:hypothetical protein N665_0076s0134 [Sinapis alba]
MKRTRDDDEPSHFLHQSSVYDDDEEEEDSSSGGFQPQPPSPPPPPQPQQKVKHFCVICSKQFSSGKAYGGHVRIHSSEYSNKGKAKKMKIKKRKNIGLVSKEKEKEKEKKIDLIRAHDVERKIRCCLCGKEFQTMHSLFGHMRRHPDRSWKGIRPPPPPEKLNLSFLDDYDDDHENENDDEDDDDEVMSGVTKEVHNAAYCLMMLNQEASERKTAVETANSEVRSFSYYCNDDDNKGKRYGEMDIEDSSVEDVKIEMEIEVNVNNPEADHEANKKRSLGFDLNQPCHDHSH